MKIHTFLDKCCTILKGSHANMGLNPVGELNMGLKTTRALIHFNTDHIKELIDNKTIADTSKVKHVLKLTNCSSVNINDNQKVYAGVSSSEGKIRASSVDVILFVVPKDWDEGKGFDYEDTFWFSGRRYVSTRGCNWFNGETNKPWYDEGSEDESLGYGPGVYNDKFLYNEYKKYLNGEGSAVIIGSQHFDYGAENFEFDITDYVNKILAGEAQNHGLGLAFSPDYEQYDYMNDRVHTPGDSFKACEVNGVVPQYYIGFFTNHTNLFFEPYLETDYSVYINDDRQKFFKGKENKLYLYCNAGSELTNLDELPTCTIEGVEYPVSQATKGVYYATVRLNDVEEDTILTDVWSNIKLNGETLEDVEMEFTVLKRNTFFTIGNTIGERYDLVPQLSGINDAEKIRIGDVRRVDVDFRIPYTTNQKAIFDSAEYRIYVKDANRQVDVYDYQPIESAFLQNYFVIDSTEMVPGEYFVDMRVKTGLNVKYYREITRFTIVSNVTEYFV
jgi:hypothetical protein